MFITFFRGALMMKSVKVLSSENNGSVNVSKKIFVDVSGAVESPGVFELDSGSRIKDALVLAGGLSPDADRDWVAKLMNLAEVLKDGQKVYIPLSGNTTSGQGYSEPVSGGFRVNVNTATIAELDTLWGIGESRASDIVKNRPYSNLDEMIEKKVVTKQILEKNKELMTVY